MLVIDATDRVAGRLASLVAKRLLSGEEIAIVNAEKAVISGNPDTTKRKYLRLIQVGDRRKGPFFPRYPDRLLKRIIRGMLPYRRPKGRAAYKRVKCYIGCPSEFKDVKKFAKSGTELSCKYITIEEVSRFLGAKI